MSTTHPRDERFDVVDAYLPTRRVADEESRRAPSGQGRIHPLFMLRNVGAPETAQAVLSARPDAADLMAWWLEAWERIQAKLDRPVQWRGNESDTSTRRGRAEAFAGICKETDPVGLPVTGLAVHARAVLFSQALADGADGERDWRLHVIEDAAAMQAVARHGIPHAVSFAVRGQALTYTGTDEDGYPILERIENLDVRHHDSVARAMRALSDDHLDYWELPGFLASAGRAMAAAATPGVASLRLLAMARAGHAKAFVKGAEVKSGTWTVDLSGVADPAQAAGRLAAAMAPYDWPDGGVLVQEHLPFTHEQRFFVLRGRIVASTCSDRHLCHLDGVPRNRLDPRVATIVRPEVAQGAYDRGVTRHVVDRRLAAALARHARRTARALSDDGLTNYTLDVGLTERGVVAVEVNSLPRSGPYGLDRDRLVKAMSKDEVGYREAEAKMDHLLERMSGKGAGNSWTDILEATWNRAGKAAPPPLGDLRFDRSDVLDRAAAALAPKARPLLSVPFVMEGPHDTRGRLVLILAEGRVVPVASTDTDGAVCARPVPYLTGKASDPVLRRLTSSVEDEEDFDRWRLFDDGVLECHAVIRDVAKGRRRELTVTVKEGRRLMAQAVAKLPRDATFAMDARLADGVLVLPRKEADLPSAWMRVVSATMRGDGSRVAQTLDEKEVVDRVFVAVASVAGWSEAALAGAGKAEDGDG